MSNETQKENHRTAESSNRCFIFGLGCLQFLPATKVSVLNVKKYCSDLDSFLRAMPAVADIRIDWGFDSEACWPEATPSPGDNEYIWPETGLEIKITLHIPSRVQEELKAGPSSETGAEDFSLTISHGYYAPVAILTADSRFAGSSGSSFVYAVRSFLDDVLNHQRQSGFVLDTIGPSPFHADFSIDERNTGESPGVPIWMTQKIRPGYDEIIWYVDTRQIAFDRAIEEILEGLRDDADVFYEIVQRRNSLLRSWGRNKHAI